MRSLFFFTAASNERISVFFLFTWQSISGTEEWRLCVETTEGRAEDKIHVFKPSYKDDSRITGKSSSINAELSKGLCFVITPHCSETFVTR